MRRSPFHWLGSGGSLLAALVPHCPLCAAASATLLSSVGLGVATASSVARWLVPFLLVAGLVGLGFGARRHGGWWMLGLGFAGSLAVYGGWHVGAQPVTLVGLALVLTASVLNLLRQRRLAEPLVRIGPQGETR